MELEGIARAASPVFRLSILCCVLKTRTLRMHPAGTLVALDAGSSTCDVAGTYRTRVLSCGPGLECTSPASRRLSRSREE